jgi:hypothetical protein
MYKSWYRRSEINNEKSGIAKAHFLSLIIAPPKSAMAICGANPAGLFGIIRYKEATRISRPIETRIDLLTFISWKYWQK